MQRACMIAFALALLACGSDAQPRIYSVRGQLAEVRDDGAAIVVDHEAIPGLMRAMSMTLRVESPSEAAGLSIGGQ